MTRRGPRSVPVLLFVFLALLDLTMLFPQARLVLEPAAALALLGAVAAAVAHVTRRRPGPPSGGVPDREPDGGDVAPSAPVIPAPRRAEAVTRPQR
jgi:hypothetical protein